LRIWKPLVARPPVRVLRLIRLPLCLAGQRVLCPVVGGSVALSTSLPGISRRAASILWSDAVRPPPSSIEHMFFCHAIAHVRKCNLNGEHY